MPDVWDFDPIFPAGTQFTPNDEDGFGADVGEWSFRARLPTWHLHPESWGGLHDFRVDVLGNAHLDVSDIRTEAGAKQLILDAAPGYAWTFQEFDFRTNCW